MNFERGLINLDNILKRSGLTSDSDVYLDLIGWQRQLQDSVANERRYAGLSPQEHERRERILRELDRFALRYASRSFVDLCEETSTAISYDSPTRPIQQIHLPVKEDKDMEVPDFRYDVFISYSNKDSTWVRGTLLPHLEGEGLRVCIDYRDFEPGLPSLVNMENAVERSRKTLIVLTPTWVESEWTAFESLLIQTDDPAGRRARMIPLRLKPCGPPKRIAMLTYVDFTQPSEVEFQLQRLVAVIRAEPVSDSPRSTSERT
jgi:hypothetical protein